jgi:NitT/TauT family transport system permease protein/taurine transport system permease protein
MWRLKPKTAIGLATVLLLLLAWYLATDVAGLIDRQRFPSLGDIWTAGAQIMTRGYAGGTLVPQALYSLRLVVLGFLVAAGTGVPLGILMGLSRRFEALVNPLSCSCGPFRRWRGSRLPSCGSVSPTAPRCW